MRVLDVHAHLPTAEGGGKELFRVPARRDFGEWLGAAHLPAAGTSGAVALQPPSYYVLTNGLEDTRRLNDLVRAATVASAGHCFAVGTVEPHHGDAALAEIDRIAQLGFAAIAWRPRAQGVFADTPIMSAFVARAADRGVVPMLHAGPRSGNEALWRVWRLAGQFPSVPIVVLGALGGWDQQQSILAEPERAPNVVYDLAGLFGDPEQLAGLADRIGHERLVFGSGGHCDGPLGGALEADHIAESALAEPLKGAILWDNAARVFNRLDLNRVDLNRVDLGRVEAAQ